LALNWEVIPIKEVRTTEELLEQLSNLNKENSVCQVIIPGIGKFTIVLQDEYTRPTAPKQANTYLKQTVDCRMVSEKEGQSLSASEITRNPFL